MKVNRQDELERFKREINLAEYASSQGYELIKPESSKNSYVMRRESDNDKIIVATDIDGHGVYFSVRDSNDNGSIIDFVQNRKGLNLGEVRKELRHLIGEQITIKHAKIKAPEPSSKDSQKALLNWTKAKPFQSHKNMQDRGISEATLQDNRFASVMRQDDRKNVLFAHYDREGLCGFEMKNEGFTGFAAGGQKGLFYTTNIQQAKRVVFTESALDALSHAESARRIYKAKPEYDPNETAYVSFAGSLSENQKDFLQSLTSNMLRKKQIMVLATDNDDAGKKFADELKLLAPTALVKVMDSPTGTNKDWNDELLAMDAAQNRATELAQHTEQKSHDFGLEM